VKHRNQQLPGMTIEAKKHSLITLDKCQKQKKYKTVA